jgi:hypothetical protein
MCDAFEMCDVVDEAMADRESWLEEVCRLAKSGGRT